MLRFAKRLGLACLALAVVHQASAFSLLGPVGGGGDAYQGNELSYDLPGVDIGAPKNLGEEYRLVAPVLYWAADSSFLDYFGSNGVRAAEQAFGLLNQLTNVSSYSADLSEFPLDSQRVNYLAQSLQLFDVKSTILSLTLEHMGLESPDRWTWALRERIPLGTTCTFEYWVINRNFDPITWAPTRYVNGARYSYVIDEFCPVVEQADAVEILVDPLTLPYTAVASFKGTPYYVYEDGVLTLQAGGLVPGAFYLTLTRDDVAGLRYLYRSSNVNYENVPTDTLQYQTNPNPQIVYGSNLTLLAAQALTNTAAQLQVLYPGLTVLSSTNFFQFGYLTNLTAYFTNDYITPVDGLPRLVITTNLTPTVFTYFAHTFGNLAVVENGPNGWEAHEVSTLNNLTNRAFNTYQVVSVTNSPWMPADSFVFLTNVTRRTYLTNAVVGEFLILPTNSCALSVMGTLLTNVIVNTNFLVQSTNNPTVTNSFGTTNTLSYEAMIIDYFTNHAFVVQPVQCVTNTAELRQGLERIQFVRSDYDSLLGRFFRPITNDYSMTAVVSNTAVVQRFRRVITVPDVQIRAEDLGVTIADRSVNFQSNAPAGLAGPGSIEPSFVITLNKVGPLRINSTFFTDETTTIATNFVWASFDSSTNDPVIYPNASSIQALENQLLIQVAPMTPALPSGKAGIDYGLTFSGFNVAGGQPPYVWSVVDALPEGLSLSSTTNSAAASILGAPVTPGVYQITIRVKDAALRNVDRPYTLKINP